MQVETQDRVGARLPEREVKLMKISLLHRQSVMAIVATVINTTIYFVLSWKTLPHVVLLDWYLTFTAFTLLRIAEDLWWRSHERNSSLTIEQIDSWKRQFDIVVFISGILWGAIGITVYPSAPVQQQVLGVLLLAGISSGAVVAYSISPRTIVSSILPMLIPLTMRLLLSKDLVYAGMAPMIILYAFLMARLGQNLARHNDQSIAFTLERASLLAERNVHKAASQAKSMFLAQVSHEIRTPLTSIIGYADRGLRSIGSARRYCLETILRNGTHLLAMVNDLLDLARIESGKILVEKQWILTAQEIASAVLIAQPAATKKNIEIEVLTHGSIPEKIYSDPGRFRQILINLIANAINFTDRGKITIESRMEGNLLQVRVSDSGIGIDQDMVDKIFEPFVRGEQGARKREPGAGLGLALALDLARALGGNLWLASSQSGEGSTFSFTVEVMAPDGIEVNGVPHVEPAASTKALVGRNILVADDDDDIRDLVSWYLEEVGVSVKVASNGAEAVTMANADRFDAILMDIQMPVMDGHTAVETLRREGHAEPIIALTAHASFDEKQRCLEHGFTAYASKPLERKLLLQMIEGNLNKSHSS